MKWFLRLFGIGFLGFLYALLLSVATLVLTVVFVAALVVALSLAFLFLVASGILLVPAIIVACLLDLMVIPLAFSQYDLRRLVRRDNETYRKLPN